MLFSGQFQINVTANDDWFDPILDADTQLFVDPFLIFKEKEGFWKTAHSTLIKHFDVAFTLIAQSSNRESLSYKKALRLLTFHEPHELCLGYTARGTKGAGGGMTYARSIALAIEDAIRRGISHPSHFEELGVLNEGIGPDRISDIACTILKSMLIQYTQDIAAKYKVPVEPHTLFASGFDSQRLLWAVEIMNLPTNPFKSGPLLLVPRRFLRDLPTLNAYDWWNFYETAMLRDDVNYEIMGKVDKKSIIEIANKHPGLVREWSTEREKTPQNGYDFANDPLGVWKWDEVTRSYVSQNPMVIAPPKDERAFNAVIQQVIARFKLFVEEQGGWYLLWDLTGKDKPEHAAQLLFRGIAQSYCRANNISLDAEVNLGRGPVDFKFSNGYSRRAHLEVKKLHNGAFWNGLEKQLPSYMRSDEVRNGTFLAIRYKDNAGSVQRERELPKRVEVLAKSRNIELSFQVVDGSRQKSASKL
ncbi:MAG: hypothetical protein WCA10_10180 [Terracidiphilus sp.]